MSCTIKVRWCSCSTGAMSSITSGELEPFFDSYWSLCELGSIGAKSKKECLEVKADGLASKQPHKRTKLRQVNGPAAYHAAFNS